MNAEQYAAYRLTDEWQKVRYACLQQYGHRCQVCGCTSWRRIIDVHHLHYRNVGHEQPEDVVPLCCNHHELIHNQPDGHDEKVLKRLQRECEESYWEDPLPAHVRERIINSERGGMKARPYCNQCLCHYDYDEDTGSCPGCGLGISANIRNPISRQQQDADFMGFTDAKRLHEADGWQKVGSLLPKIPGQ